ncbi:MAG: hypothetical protein ACRCX2_16870 [Paraclostridium sp.]
MMKVESSVDVWERFYERFPKRENDLVVEEKKKATPIRGRSYYEYTDPIDAYGLRK